MVRWIIVCYLVQSIIELTASSLPALAAFLSYFNHAQDDQVASGGVRGVALASGTTWSLGLTYGMVFIMYFREYLMDKVNLKTVGGLMVLVVGTFFAGRTGFVGACIGFAYFFIFSRKGIHKKLAIFVYVAFFIVVICQIALIFFPEYVYFALNSVLPWALEPIFNFLDGKGVSTSSTDVLDEMWKNIPTINQALTGTGNFTNPDGSYYMHTDVGILRNLFYWGVGGYVVLISYQIYVMLPMFLERNYRNMTIVTGIYLMFCEYKAMTLGFNKMALSILFLLSFTQYIRSRCLK
ncbi:MAG: hypothetical protein K2O56_05435 [Muribaculaceae bacterium]|nr:hypothetical protein [Muribaculaceae bacterium]